MAGLVGLLIMAGFLGLGAFGVGMLPLMFSFSRIAVARMSSLGTGLLLGTALGVIIPEGVEIISETNSSRFFPTTRISLSLAGGFVFMLLVERLIHRYSPHSHAHAHAPVPTADPARTDSSGNRVEFDVELDQLESAEGAGGGAGARQFAEPDTATAYPLTLGLMVHALADGLALGTSATSPVDKGLSALVFLALIVHKAPTVLALSTSLLATSLPRSECRKHIAVFAASTPIGAIIAYSLLSIVRINSESPWTGVAMLVSGGTFLYVAAVLQPGKSAAEELDEKARLALTVSGIFIPVLVGALVGHDH